MTENIVCEKKFHNPSKYKNPVGRFFHYIFALNKLYFRKDDTALCDDCCSFVRVPLAYYHWGVKIVYAIMSSIVASLSVLMVGRFGIPVVSGLLAAGFFSIVVLVFMRISTAIIFAFFPWRKFDDKNYDAEAFCLRAKREREKRWQAVFIGIMVAVLPLIYIAQHL